MNIVTPNWTTRRDRPAPGSFFALWVGKRLIYGFTTEPRQPHQPPGWLALHDPENSGFRGQHRDRLESQNMTMQLTDVEIRFAEPDLRYGEDDQVPSGALVLAESAPHFLVKKGDGVEFAVELATGAIGGSDLWRSFGLPRWQLVRRTREGTVVTVFEFDGRPTNG